MLILIDDSLLYIRKCSDLLQQIKLIKKWLKQNIVR